MSDDEHSTADQMPEDTPVTITVPLGDILNMIFTIDEEWPEGREWTKRVAEAVEEAVGKPLWRKGGH